MSQKTFIAAIIISAFSISLVAGMQSVEVVEANPLPPAWMNPEMTITIQSPQNETENALPVFVNYTVQCTPVFSLSDNQTQDWIKSFFYVLDGQNMSSSGINFTETQLTGTYPTDSDHYYDYSGQAYLINLTDGIHSITVYYGVLVNVGSPAEFIAYNASWSAISQFYVTTENPIPTPSPTPSPSTPEFPSWIILPLILTATVALAVTLLTVLFIKRKKSPD
jgi:hypothetical protein